MVAPLLWDILLGAQVGGLRISTETVEKDACLVSAGPAAELRYPAAVYTILQSMGRVSC